MTKNERIKELGRAVVEIGLLLGYRIDFKKFSIPKPLPWAPTIIEQLRTLREELGIKYIKLTQPKTRTERIEVVKEKKNAKK